MSLLNEIYEYKSLKRDTCNKTGKRVYDTPSGKLPSVTTIIDQTSDKSAIQAWRDFIGEQEADFITNLSAGIGSLMHLHLENYIKGDERPGGTSYARKISKHLADVIIEKGLINVDEVWGLESPLYYPGLYAGTADVIGVWKGKPAIMDFKNTRKPKKTEWIKGYELQLCAYAMAHNELYGTDIRQGVILMASREEEHLGAYQEFEINTKEVENSWLDMLEQFYGVQT